MRNHYFTRILNNSKNENNLYVLLNAVVAYFQNRKQKKTICNACFPRRRSLPLTTVVHKNDKKSLRLINRY